ncbi:MAG TPA: glycosyltransferase family 39 protein [Solirubrobacteraceae bacterium]|nr:glycosyltransferase family 39 protein [Solirubrobacteraceae bacterium]
MSIDWDSGAGAETARRPIGFGAVAARAGERLAAVRRGRPELLALLALAAVLDMWALSRNGWANSYYSAAVRSMSSSWHDFLFASLDRSGVMTVDKPPAALWVQALSVRVFGFHPLSMLVPQALMGVASVGLLYDLVRRRFGRLGGAIGGLALALTPVTVAISRYNQPDALLVLCSVVALWCAVRALEAGPAGRSTRWLVAAGAWVGLGFETKMLVALVVVPGIVAAWLWVAPAARGRLHALRQLLAGGAAMLLVGGAWPLLVELTPASARPWISGTSDNRVLSLIFEYNGVGRVDGQAGGPGGFGGSQFGGQTGPLRLLNSALGGQGGWLLGFAALSALALLIASRLRRGDERSGWLLAVGGAFVTTAVLFSFASGIFHPYYVSLLAPFTAALVGAGAAHFVRGREGARVLAPVAIVAGVATELVVLGDYSGQLGWLVPVLIVVCGGAAVALALRISSPVRLAAVALATGALLLAPGVWAFDTVGRTLNGTFPEGGPANVQSAGGFGGMRRIGGPPGGFGGFAAPGAGAGAGGGSTPPPAAGGGLPGAGGEGAPRLFGSGAGNGGAGGALPGFGGGRGGFGGTGPGGFGGAVSSEILSYVKTHGGGTIAVGSQSSAAESILSGDAEVAGIGGFSGRESDVSVAWLASEVREGRIRWVVGEGPTGSVTGRSGGTLGLPGDSRQGSKKAVSAAEAACRRVTLSGGSEAEAGTLGAAGTSSTTLYDCRGRAAQLARLGA